MPFSTPNDDKVVTLLNGGVIVIGDPAGNSIHVTASLTAEGALRFDLQKQGPGPYDDVPALDLMAKALGFTKTVRERLGIPLDASVQVDQPTLPNSPPNTSQLIVHVPSSRAIEDSIAGFMRRMHQDAQRDTSLQQAQQQAENFLHTLIMQRRAFYQQPVLQQQQQMQQYQQQLPPSAPAVSPVSNSSNFTMPPPGYGVTATPINRTPPAGRILPLINLKDNAQLIIEFCTKFRHSWQTRELFPGQIPGRGMTDHVLEIKVGSNPNDLVKVNYTTNEITALNAEGYKAVVDLLKPLNTNAEDTVGVKISHDTNDPNELIAMAKAALDQGLAVEFEAVAANPTARPPIPALDIDALKAQLAQQPVPGNPSKNYKDLLEQKEQELLVPLQSGPTVV